MFTYSLGALAPRLLAPYPPAMPRCRPLVLAVMLALNGALTCGDDPIEPAALAELCGHADPTRLLALPPGRRLSVDTVPLHVGDRHVFLTAIVDPNYSGDLETDRDLWSTGPCGEDPRQLLPSVRWISTLNDRWPGILIACDDTGLHVVDPADGTTAPFLRTASCDLGPTGLTDHGLLTLTNINVLGQDFGALTLHPYPIDPRGEPPPAIELHPSLRVADHDLAVNFFGPLFHAGPDLAFGIDDTATLVRIDLADASVHDEASDVLAFDTSPTGQHILWQSPPLDDSYNGPLFLKDRSTGTSAAVGHGSVIYPRDPFEFIAQDLISLHSAPNNDTLVHLPDFTIVNTPALHLLAGVIDERRWLVHAYEPDGLALYDPTRDQLTPLFVRPGNVLSFTPERAFYVAVDPDTALSQGPLYRVEFTGDEPTRIAHHASRYTHLLGDTRIVTTVDLDDDLHGELLLIAIPTGDERGIDTHVHARTAQQDAGFGPDHILYSVDDGERTGIYLARLPPG